MIIEASFRQARINLESTKADYLVANLDHDLIPHIKHILELEPKPADVYSQIKNQLIKSFSISAETRLRKLLRGEVVSEGKPSLLLTRLRALNGGNCSDAVIKSVFLEQMPSQIRAILALSNVDDLQELANLADKVSEASQPLNYQVASISTHLNIPSQSSSVSATNDNFSPLVNILTKQFERLSNDIRDLKMALDTTTGFSVLGFLKPALVCGLSTISREHAFSHILESFPTITSLQQGNTTLNVDIHHHILTTGPPVHDRARRLSPEKLTAAKAIFRQMLEDGICRPSSSPWETPIHMIKKKNGDWCVCCDFLRLNAITIPDRYPVPTFMILPQCFEERKFFQSSICSWHIIRFLSLPLISQKLPL